MPELPKTYSPAEHEPRITQRWEESRAFHPDPERVLSGQAKPYCILMPPPNVTGALHLGHALNNTLQDMLIRAHRMMGFETLWMPGTDHAGIATQAVVERRLRKEGKLKGPLKDAMTRDEFVAQVQVWKDEYEARITAQLKAMGASCDYDRQRFTMDEICARAVREAFFRLFKDGLIYRGKRLVNWDPVLQTAVSDDECYDEEVDSFFYYLRYPLVRRATDLRADGKGSGHTSTTPGPQVSATPINPTSPLSWSELAARGYPGAEQHPPEQQAWVTVATTRAETYLGDTAVAINPKDPRAVSLRGLFAELPLIGRVIPIIEDAYVVLPHHPTDTSTPSESIDPKALYATGFLKVTPAHDPNDYEIGQRHKLPMINIFAPDATISDKHGWSDADELRGGQLFLGRSREDARKNVIAEFKSRGLLEDPRPYRHSITHSDRSKAVIEPYLSDQWYLRVTDDRLAGAANRALVPDQRSERGPALSGGPALRAGRIPPDLSILDHFPFTLTCPPGFIGRDPYPSGQPSPRDLIATRRFLPHLELPGATYFVTWRTGPGITLSEDERAIALRAVKHFDGNRIHLYAAVVMPDHIHCVLRCAEGFGLQEWTASIKRFSAREINAARADAGSIWQDEALDHIIRDVGHLAEYLQYIAENLVKDGLAAHPSTYAWSYFGTSILEAMKAASGGRHASGSESRTTTEPESKGDNTLRFYPARYAKMYESWHDNIRDWCISRQLWWGHRIPVWSFEPSIPAAKADFQDAWEHPDDFASELHLRLSNWCKAEGVHANFVVRVEPDKQCFFICTNNKTSTSLLDRFAIAIQTQHLTGSLDLVEMAEGGVPFLRTKAMLSSLARDPDVLDTWFSSALWPLSTLGWPDPAQSPQTQNLLPAFNPTTVLSTAREIITLWVSRMVMMNRYLLPEGWGSEVIRLSEPDASLPSSAHSQSTQHSFAPTDALPNDPARPARSAGPPPFHDVFIHAVVQDGDGKRMSKSAGNGVDPLDIIATHGADAMRFTLAQMATNTQDVRMPVTRDSASGKNTSPKFDVGRNFCNKLWNAARYTLSILDRASTPSVSPSVSPSPTPPLRHSVTSPSSLPLPDRWLLSRLATTTREAERCLKNYEFAEYIDTLYKLLWWDFCDWYLEAIKPTVDSSPAQQAVLAHALDTIVRLLHPVIPFVTEAIWDNLKTLNLPSIDGLTLGPSPTGLLATAPWPRLSDSLIDPAAEAQFESLREIITAIRNVRSEHQVLPKRRITLHAPAAFIPRLSAAPGLVETLAGLEHVITTPPTPGTPHIAFRAGGEELTVTNLADAVDAGAEKDRLAKQLQDLRKSETALNGRLSNPGYALKAPPKLVEESKAQLAKIREEIGAVEAKLRVL